MTMQLPVTDDELIRQTQQEFDAASKAGKNTSDAGTCLVYALVHSRHVKRDVGRGIELATVMIERPGAGEQHQKELLYLRAVGKFQLGKYLEARKQLDEILKVAPEAEQARALKQMVEDQIVKEGLIGLGAVGGFLGIAALVVGGIVAGSRK